MSAPVAGTPQPEPRAIAQKRLIMRSMRRGIREMDLILQDFSTRCLDALTDADLALYDRLLDESDHDIYAWVCGRGDVPAAFAPLVAQISDGAQGVTKP